jgi:hypothetical protein
MGLPTINSLTCSLSQEFIMTENTPKITEAPEGYTSPILTGDWHITIVALVSDDDTTEYLSKAQQNWGLHPAVVDALNISHPVCGLPELILQWPHASEEDPTMLAYTQSREKALRNLQTRVKLGRYLTKFWPNIRDDVLRGIADKYIGANMFEFEMLTDADDIVRSAMKGPNSCMRTVEHDASYHPYRCYDPRLGWSCAVRYRTVYGMRYIVGRALVYEGVYVRSFKADDDNIEGTGYSQSDEKLQAWLHGQGIHKRSGWPTGTRLAVVYDDNDRQVAPYIDGTNDHTKNHHTQLTVTKDDGTTHAPLNYFELGSGGICLDSADGWLDDCSGAAEDTTECDHCEETVDTDDTQTVLDSDGDEICVCDYCCRHHYSSAANSNFRVPDDTVEETVEGVSICIAGWADLDDFTKITHGQHAGEWTRDCRAVVDVDGGIWHTRDLVSEDLMCCSDGEYRAADAAEAFEAEQEEQEESEAPSEQTT